MKQVIITEVIAHLIAILLLFTGIGKLYHHAQFVVQLKVSPIHLLSNIAPVFAILLPVAEITAGILLLWPSWRMKGYVLALLLFICFTLYLAVLLQSGQPLPCSCGGIINSLSWKGHLLLNLACIILCATGIQKHVYLNISNN